MRKTVATLVAAGLLLGAVAMPAGAAKKGKKKKKIEDSFSATLLPLPKLAAMDPTGELPPGCLAGEQDVHWAAVTFEPPANGEMVAHMEGFTGDWDLYLLDDAGAPLVRSENNQILDQAPAEEEVSLELKKGQTVSVAICNWLGAPQAEAHYVFTYVVRGGKKGGGGGGGHHH